MNRPENPIRRRTFLASACAVPVLVRLLEPPPAYSEETIHQAPYLKLQSYLAPGHDEFHEEAAAMRAEAALQGAVRARALPVSTNFRGVSLLAASWRSAAPDVSVAVFKDGEALPDSGFTRWLDSLGSIRQARFFVLPDDVVRYEIASRSDNRLLYTVGRWKVQWQADQFSSLAPVEETRASLAEPMFRDVTGVVFDGGEAFREQFSRGIPYWRARLDPASGIDIYGNNGIAAGDIDNDGVDEIYVCQPGGLPNRLLKYRDGRFEDITDAWGVGLLDDTSSALFLDLRNSGRQDLVVLRASGPLLYLNEGDRFRLRDDAFRFATKPQGGFTGMAAADYDRDGKLDLYLCCYIYFQSEAQYTYAVPYHDANNGPPNFLFRNKLDQNGAGAFEDVTAEAGMNQNNHRFSFAPAWCDADGSGWPSLYVANDFGRNNFYRNRDGKFTDVAAEAGVEDIGPGMSTSWFDYDGDGRPDLYVANMWSAPGQRIVHSPQFAPAQGAGMAEAYHRHTTGNSLFRNDGDGKFEETTDREQVAMGRWAWSSVGRDLDNDGSQEIVVACGMLSNTSEKDVMSFFWRQVVSHSPQTAQESSAYENGWNAINQFIREDYSWSGREPNVVYVRRGDRFYDVSGVSGLDFADDSRALTITDFDGDGRPDVILKSRMGPQIRVMQNNCAAKNHSIAFDLRGTRSNRDAIGAKIEVNGRAVWLDAGNGYISQHSKRVVVGLGQSQRAERIRITWPSGLVQEAPPLDAGFVYEITEGSAEISHKPFAKRSPLPGLPFAVDNEPRLHSTWLLQPLPLPEPQSGPALLILKGSEPASPPAGVPVRTVDLSAAGPNKREIWSIFRRYLFDYRAPLVTPFAMLLNASGKAVKVYEQMPSAGDVRSDLATLSGGLTGVRGLPLKGAYYRQPHRDYFKFGAALLWAGFSEPALPYLEEVLQDTPDNSRVVLLVGQIHLEANRIDQAEKYIRKALAIDPAYADAWSDLGGVFDARKNVAEALNCYEKALSLKPDLPYALMNAAQASEKAGNREKAEQYYRRALASDPHNAEAANGLGLLFAKEGHTDEARKLFEQAIAERRDYGMAINNLGVLYLETGKPNEALAAYEYGIRVAPDEDILYLNLGRIYARQGQTERAREVMQRLLTRKPGNQIAERALRELERRP